MKEKVIEWCSNCGQEVKIDAIPYVAQKCPNCGALIRACCLCDCDKVDCNKCEKKFPKEEK
jgi:predicted RNA-binding Zn-ribbon protein involved in translation (DUF1610 family)